MLGPETAYPSLMILGYSEAAMFLRRTPAPPVRAILAIHGQREFGVEAVVPHRLDLGFDDVDVVNPADVMSLHRALSRKRWCELNGLKETAPVPDDAAKVIRFAEAICAVDGIVLCHCGAGISRASAAALICLAVWRGAGREPECVAEILQIRPSAAPHRGLIQFADDLLCRGGRLVEAAASARRS